MSARGTVVLAMMALAAAGCGEKPQATSERKADAKGYDLARSGSLAPGWQGGDHAAWERQLRTRAEGQNEYQRTGGQRTAPAAAAPAAVAAASAAAPKSP